MCMYERCCSLWFAIITSFVMLVSNNSTGLFLFLIGTRSCCYRAGKRPPQTLVPIASPDGRYRSGKTKRNSLLGLFFPNSRTTRFVKPVKIVLTSPEQVRQGTVSTSWLMLCRGSSNQPLLQSCANVVNSVEVCWHYYTKILFAPTEPTGAQIRPILNTQYTFEHRLPPTITILFSQIANISKIANSSSSRTS